MKCCVDGCRNRPGLSKTAKNTKDGKIVSAHSFPSRDKSPLRHRAWLKRTNFIGDVRPSTFVCSAHFTDADFELSASLMQQFGLGSSKQRSPNFILKKTAVPSLLLRAGDQSAPEKTTRKQSTYQRKKIVAEAMSEAYSKKITTVKLIEVHPDINIYEDEDTSEDNFQTEDKSSVLDAILKRGQSRVSEWDIHLDAECETRPFIETGLDSSTELSDPLAVNNEMGIQCELGMEQYRTHEVSSSVEPLYNWAWNSIGHMK